MERLLARALRKFVADNVEESTTWSIFRERSSIKDLSNLNLSATSLLIYPAINEKILVAGKNREKPVP